jgi:glycosyltransferase involved in cell wall biosynthesis
MEKVIVLTTSYNCAEWLERCLTSIQLQSYKDFVCYITDDLSTDNTCEIAQKFTELDERFILVRNTVKHYQPGNYDQILRDPTHPEESIVIEVDGDDWLSHPQVFEKIVEEHKKGYWITQGSFQYSDGRPGFANSFYVKDLRQNPHLNATHLRTWRVKLWRAIKKDDLKLNGEYASTAGDVFFMLPMLEMAGDDRIKFIEETMYVYNESNPINDHKVDMHKQWEFARKGRNKKPYKKLK